MKRLSVVAAGLLVAFTVFGCASMDSGGIALSVDEKGMG